MPEVLSYTCPFCGCEVRVGKTCPGCAKKTKTRPPKKRSWEQDASHDGLDLPDEDFDYEKFIAREFGKSPHWTLGFQWYWWLLAVMVLAAMICGVLWIR